jgi:hypothetical protein
VDSRWVADNLIELAKIEAGQEERISTLENRQAERDKAYEAKKNQRPQVWQVWLAAIALALSAISTGASIYFATHQAPPIVIRVPTYIPQRAHP